MFQLKLSELDKSLERSYNKQFAQKSEQLRQFLLDSSKQYADVFCHWDLTRLHLKLTKLSQKIGLAIMSWYMNDEIRFLTQQSLLETWGADSKEVKEVILTSKEFALSWLIIQERWSERDFFGNVLTKSLSQLWNATNFYKVSRKPVKRYSGYCRGYQESNRGPVQHLPAELQLNYLSYDEIQARKLQEELVLHQLLGRIVEFLEKKEVS